MVITKKILFSRVLCRGGEWWRTEFETIVDIILHIC